MPTILSGLIDEQDQLADEKKVDMEDMITMLDTDEQQFMTATRGRKITNQDAINPKCEWLEDQYMPRVTTVSGAQTSGDTSIEVATGTGQYFRAGDLVRVQTTNEAFRVSSISTDTLTVTRGIGGVAAAAISDGDQVVIVSNAANEGATLGTRLVTKTAAGFNYCQISRHPFGYTETAIATSYYGGSQPEREESKKWVEHLRSLEASMFFGPRGIDTSGSEPRRYSGGALEFISTYVKNAAGALTKANFDLFMQDGLFRGEGRNKVLFAAPTVARALSGFLRDAWQPTTTGSDRVFGAHVDAWISGAYGWRIPVIVKREWNEFSTASTQWGGYAFLIDLDAVALCYLRRPRLLRNRQANDADERTHEYLTECTLRFKQEPRHLLIKGVTG